MANLPTVSPEILKAYQEEISRTSSPATFKRKEVSLNRFFDWAKNVTKKPSPAMNAAYAAFVTGVVSSQNPGTSTACAGRSS